MLCAGPVFAPCGARPPACWAAPKRPPLPGRTYRLGRAAARLSLTGRPQAGGRAPLRCFDGRGFAPHQTPALGRLKTLGRFVFGGSPGPLVVRLGPARPRVLRPGTGLHRAWCAGAHPAGATQRSNGNRWLKWRKQVATIDFRKPGRRNSNAERNGFSYRDDGHADRR